MPSKAKTEPLSIRVSREGLEEWIARGSRPIEVTP